MLLLFIIIIFLVLHIQFLLRNIFFGLDEVSFFQFTITYGFTEEVAIESLLFSTSCLIAFIVGYKIFYRKRGRMLSASVESYSVISSKELLMLNAMGVVMITYLVVVILLADFNYKVMTQIREVNGFIFELRIVYLLLLSHVLLNVPWRYFISMRGLKATRIIVLVYMVCLLFFQARSVVFELVAIVLITQLMWLGDKIRMKYVFIVFFMMLVPNVIVMGRLGVPDNFPDLISAIFSFEYSISINSFLSAAIDTGVERVREISFISSLGLLIPSPIRDFIGLSVIKSDYYSEIAEAANIRGGGFSLLAEMYSNFGWLTLFIFSVIGAFVGVMLAKAARVGRVGIVSSTAPLLYIAFVLAFRNDFGVFLKYVVYLYLISFFIALVYGRRKKRPLSGSDLNRVGNLTEAAA